MITPRRTDRQPSVRLRKVVTTLTWVISSAPRKAPTNDPRPPTSLEGLLTRLLEAASETREAQVLLEARSVLPDGELPITIWRVASGLPPAPFAAALLTGNDDPLARDARLVLAGEHPDVREFLRVGPAMDDLDVGPLISAQQRNAVRTVLDRAAGDPAVQVLARAPLPATLPNGGFYVAPTLLAGALPTHTLAQDEIFGPVQLLLPFDDEADAIRIANGTAYGLVAGVWTRDGARQMRMAHALKCGQVFINNYGAGGGVELPFGGVKHSGHGREKGFEALYGFSVVKTVAVQHG